jgi:hypothetical protein
MLGAFGMSNEANIGLKAGQTKRAAHTACYATGQLGRAHVVQPSVVAGPPTQKGGHTVRDKIKG